MKRKKLLLAIGVIGILGAVAITQVGNMGFNVITNADESYSLTLGAGDITNLTSEATSNTFTKATTSGNSVSFEYKNAKSSSSNLISLEKTAIGYSAYNQDYLGNTSAITSLTDVTVSFSGSDYLFVYASPDNTHFYKVDVLSPGVVTTAKVKNYLYVRFVNGDAENHSCVITAIGYNYGCNAADYNDEGSDFINTSPYATSSCTFDKDTTYKLNWFNSSNCRKIAHSGSNGQSDIRMPFASPITGAELKKMAVTLYFDTTANDSSTYSHTYSRVLIYAYKGSSKTSNNFTSANVNDGVAWTEITCNFSSITSIDDATEYDGIWFRTQYCKTGYIDQVRIYYAESYPTMSQEIIDKYEANDKSNNTFTVPYSGAIGSTSYSVKAANSVRSSKITMTADYKMWYYANCGMENDLTGKTFTFDFLPTDYSQTKSESLSYVFKHTYESQVKVFTAKIIPLVNDGVTVTQQGDWKHITIDFDTLITNAAVISTAKDSGSLGFNLGIARTAYIDNLVIA